MTQFRGTLSDDEERKIWKECQSKTRAINVSSLYSQMNTNPDRLDNEGLERRIYRCLAKNELLPQPISENEYMQSLSGANDADNMDKYTQARKRWNDFFREYMPVNEEGQPNPDYNEVDADRFWSCNRDPLQQ